MGALLETTSVFGGTRPVIRALIGRLGDTGLGRCELNGLIAVAFMSLASQMCIRHWEQTNQRELG